MKNYDPKDYTPRTRRRHKRILALCQKTTLQRVKYTKDGKQGIEVLIHAPQVLQSVKKVSNKPANRTGYKASKVSIVEVIGKSGKDTFYPITNSYSKKSVNDWNKKK